MIYQQNYKEIELTKEQIIEELTNNLRTLFPPYININYDPRYLDKDLEYYKRTLKFFNPDTINDVVLAYKELAKKKTPKGRDYTYILIDAENIFHKMGPEEIELILLDLIVKYNYPCIVIFCQNHSINANKRLYGLQKFLLQNSNTDITIFTDDSDHSKLRLLGHQNSLLEVPPVVPSQTECDDILLMACYAYLKQYGKTNVLVLTGDNMRWSTETTIDAINRICKATGKKRKKIKLETKKQRTRTKPKLKKQSRMGRSPHKPKKQRTITRIKSKPKK